MIGMTSGQLLSSCLAIRQGVPVPRAHSEFFYLFFGVENTSATVRLNRMSASLQICALCSVPVFPLTLRLDKSLLQAFTEMMVTSSCPGAGPQGESSE